MVYERAERGLHHFGWNDQHSSSLNATRGLAILDWLDSVGTQFEQKWAQTQTASYLTSLGATDARKRWEVDDFAARRNAQLVQLLQRLFHRLFIILLLVGCYFRARVKLSELAL
jgi:hypothetical protein